MEKEVKYTRLFSDLTDNELIVTKWLRIHGGVEGDKWRSAFMGKYYTMVGHCQSDVGVVGDLLIEIFDPSLAFQFEIFKVGGRQRDRVPMPEDELESEYEKNDLPVLTDDYFKY